MNKMNMSFVWEMKVPVDHQMELRYSGEVLAFVRVGGKKTNVFVVVGRKQFTAKKHTLV
ncbi:hypothetical protein ACFLZC_02890 [Patescibacteria group bacterium]